MAKTKRAAGITLRPYELLCMVCALGRGRKTAEDQRSRELLAVVRDNPQIPTTLRCDGADLFGFQNPGTRRDTPEGLEFNLKRDLETLKRLDLAPGSTLPARILFLRLWERIPNVSGICTFGTVTSDAWRGCPRAEKRHYEKGHARGIEAVIPKRTRSEMARDKRQSIKALGEAKEIPIRPHLLMCAICQYGSGVRPPFEEDNLPELLQMILNEKPDLPIRLVRGADWFMCAPCPYRFAELNACVTGRNACGGIYNEIKDLNMLQALGLTYGTVMEGEEILRVIVEKIPEHAGVCALDNGGLPPHSVWWNACDAQNAPPAYKKGRKLVLAKLKQAE